MDTFLHLNAIQPIQQSVLFNLFSNLYGDSLMPFDTANVLRRLGRAESWLCKYACKKNDILSKEVYF